MPLYDPYVTPIFYASFIYQDSYIKAVYSIMLRWLRNDPFVFVMDFPTLNDAFVLSSFRSHTPLVIYFYCSPGRVVIS